MKRKLGTILEETEDRWPKNQEAGEDPQMQVFEAITNITVLKRL